MKNVREKLGVVENLGWLDRVLRITFGAALISVPCFYIFSGYAMSLWFAFLMLFSVYPIMTGILGYDLLYNLFGVKTCDTSERNQCGTFPYEIDAALGRKPIPNSDIEHSLMNAHHDSTPKHAV